MSGDVLISKGIAPRQKRSEASDAFMWHDLFFHTDSVLFVTDLGA